MCPPPAQSLCQGQMKQYDWPRFGHVLATRANPYSQGEVKQYDWLSFGHVPI